MSTRLPSFVTAQANPESPSFDVGVVALTTIGCTADSRFVALVRRFAFLGLLSKTLVRVSSDFAIGTTFFTSTIFC